MIMNRAGFYPGEISSNGQPFPEGICGCRQFRIPGIIKLHNGALFAVADARWDDADSDYGGIDTLFSVSYDNGRTWNTGFSAMFPDSNGTPYDPKTTTTCIDPCVVQDKDGTVHIFVNMNPSGITTGLGWPNTGNGFVSVNGKQRLSVTPVFSDADVLPSELQKEKSFYVGDYLNGKAKILDCGGGDTGYSVDRYYNLYKDDMPLLQKQIDGEAEIYQNIFYKDSEFHVYNTMFTLHLTSDDEGRSWIPEIISSSIKNDDEGALISSPGNGEVTPSGTLLMPFYVFSKEYKGYPLIVFSDDNGKTWSRTPCFTGNEDFVCTGENKVIALSDNKWRVFFRNQANRICFADFLRDEFKWINPVKTDITIHSDCNLSAIAYNGKIYISAPAGRGPEAKERCNGTLFVFDLNEDDTMSLSDRLLIEPAAFSYSCLVAADNGIKVLFDTCGDGFVIMHHIDC